MTNIELEKKIKDLENQLDETKQVIAKLSGRMFRHDEVVGFLRDELDRQKTLVEALKVANNNAMKSLSELLKK
jgi:uncharacterized coiled-coil protein SlyX